MVHTTGILSAFTGPVFIVRKMYIIEVVKLYFPYR